MSAPYFKASNGHHIDAVLFLSAKKTALDTASAEIVPFVGSDFETAEELFQQIIALSEWLSFDEVKNMSMEALEKELKQIMDIITPLIVIDDIDTLTTLGRDAGMEALLLSTVRAKKGAKILYTLRNIPSHSIAQAIEVPGMEYSEYLEFIGACCAQFKQPVPSAEIIDGPLATMSERRPLLVEALIGLRRTAGTYDNALELLRMTSGDQIRSYLFDREYQHLSDNRSRYILAALSLLRKPMGNADLEIVTRYNPDQVAHALGEVGEMFLTRVPSEGGETLYALSQATQDYVAIQREQLDLIAQLKQRVQNYVSSFVRQPRELAQLLERVRKALYYYKDPSQALTLLELERDPKVTEHPVYQSWIGVVAAAHDPPLVEKAREAFQFASTLARLEPDAVRTWFYIERTSGTGIDNAIEICNSVISDKKYSDAVRTEFQAKKGFVLKIKAENLGPASPERTVEYLSQALDCNMIAFNDSINLADMDVEIMSEWTDRCAQSFASACIQYSEEKDFFDKINGYAKNGLVCDPIKQSIFQVCFWAGKQTRIGDINRIIGVLNHFLRSFTRAHESIVFSDSDIRNETVNIIERTIENAERLKENLRIRRP